MTENYDQEELAEIKDEPTYNPRLAKYAANLIARGCTDKEVEEILDADGKWTVKQWRKSVHRFAKQCKVAENKADVPVLAALQKLCNGFDYEEISYTADKKVKSIRKKYQPPNEAAIEFWMCNRDPSKWQRATKVDGRNKTLTSDEIGENESRQIQRHAGRLLQICTEDDGGEHQVSAETAQFDSERPRIEGCVPVYVPTETGVDIRHSILDVQSEGKEGLQEYPVCVETPTADSGQKID